MLAALLRIKGYDARAAKQTASQFSKWDVVTDAPPAAVRGAWQQMDEDYPAVVEYVRSKRNPGR